jgi:predicted cupin superfamily sugar epimerase
VLLDRIRNDQLYHYYLGDPLEVYRLHAAGPIERSSSEPDLRGGQTAICRCWSRAAPSTAHA